MPKLKYVKKAADLLTPDKVTRSGFLQQALRKTKEANPYVERAKYLLDKIQLAKTPEALFDIKEIRNDLVTAAGFSDKAVGYFSAADLKNAFSKVLAEINSKPNTDWRTEIIYRFLLTRGDTLGGVMRNIMGAEAKIIFTETVLNVLQDKKLKANLVYNKENKIVQISWNDRILVFDRTPKLIGKNIDTILLRGTIDLSINDIFANKTNYLACGEIKGGIDPAGADEHWKTASGGLERIRIKLKDKVKLFFVAAAIENSMAKEIYSQLKSGKLDYAANLTDSLQLSDLATWLISC